MELRTAGAARYVAGRYTSSQGSKRLRIGRRDATVQLSSEDELMQSLFPCAHGVSWDGTNPEVFRSGTSKFRGFVDDEEMDFLARNAEEPHRVSRANILSLSL